MLTLEEELTLLQNKVDVPSREHLINISQKCKKEKNDDYARRLYSVICTNKLEAHGPLGNYLVPMFVECSSLSYAEEVFYRLSHRNKYAWNSLVKGYIENGNHKAAFDLFQQMEVLSIHPSIQTLQILLKTCARMKWLKQGWRLHNVIAKEGFETDLCVCSSLINMYSQCGAFIDACEVLHGCQSQDIVLWTSLISGYVEHGDGEKAFECLNQMQDMCADATILVCFLKACSQTANMQRGHQIHKEICLKGLEKSVIVGSALLDMYAKCGFLEEAQDIFDALVQQDVVSWTALVACYAENERVQDVQHCLEKMQVERISPNEVTYICSLKSYTSRTAISEGQKLHVCIVKVGFDLDLFVGNALLDMYAQCGLHLEAEKTFYSLPIQDLVSWTTLIAGYVKNGLNEEAFSCLEEMRMKGSQPNSNTLACILKACCNTRNIVTGQAIHYQICSEGYDKDTSVLVALMEMYTKMGYLVEARDAFDEIRTQDTAVWNMLIAGHVEQGFNETALEYLGKMILERNIPNAATYVWVLKACGNMKDIVEGQKIHMYICLTGLEGEHFVGNALINMYAKCGSLVSAEDVFDGLSVRDVISWNTLLTGYAECGYHEEIFIIVKKMHLEGVLMDSVTIVCILRACASTQSIEIGQHTHAELCQEGFEKDCFVVNSLVVMYCECGFLQEAQDVFDDLPMQSTVGGSTLAAGYAEHGHRQKAFDCIAKIHEGMSMNTTVAASCLETCGKLGATGKGREIHNEVVKKGFDKDPYVGTALVDMYAHLGVLIEAKVVFNKIDCPDIVAWNVFLAACVENDFLEEVLSIFDWILERRLSPSIITYVYCLRACSTLRAVNKGQKLHVFIIEDNLEDDPSIGRALIDMYAKCGLIIDARDVFEALPFRNVASWNALIAGYFECGLNEETLNAFECMQLDDILPDAVTLSITLKACGCIAAVGNGCRIHMNLSAEGVKVDHLLGNALVDMYARCGLLVESRGAFEELQIRDTVSWSCLLAGYVRFGNFRAVFELFERMKEDCVRPDAIIFLNMLTACAHAGLVNKGQEVFKVMVRDYNIKPTTEHNNCMLDLFSRTGQLDEAVYVFEKECFQLNLESLTILLSGCQKWGHLELGQHIFQSTFKVADNRALVAFILMSNIHADSD